jgi:hypothetical protein
VTDVCGRRGGLLHRHMSALDLGAVRAPHDSEEPGHANDTTIGLDIAKSVFQVHCVDPLSILRVSGKPAAEKALPIDLPMRPMPISIVTLKGRTISPAAHLFIECARKIVKPRAKAI